MIRKDKKSLIFYLHMQINNLKSDFYTLVLQGVKILLAILEGKKFVKYKH